MAQNETDLPDAVATEDDRNIVQTDNSGDPTLPAASQDPNFIPDDDGDDDVELVDVDEVEL